MPIKPLPTYPISKWLMDKLISLTFIALFSPVFLFSIVGIAIGMLLHPADRGSWFYRERRISRGRQFDVLKFRILREDVLERGRREGKHARMYEGDVENLTWAGQYLLKKWYFDELPQLFNIFKGDMSLVGPRPWPVHMVEAQIEKGITYRHLIMAGWTGPVQVTKGHNSLLKHQQIDLEYLAQCLTWPKWKLFKYDLEILRETLRTMLEGKGLKY
ncbi:sugar transferase [Anaerolineales bacterium HSG25]|nr:sugar transferase [Anaerolineales bacterium HSG25]